MDPPTYVSCNIEARSCNHCCCGRANVVEYLECVSVVLITQHAKRMRRVNTIVCGLSSLRYFSILSYKQHDLREKVVERKMCVLIFSTNPSETFLILRRIKRDVTINNHWSIIIVGFNET